MRALSLSRQAPGKYRRVPILTTIQPGIGRHGVDQQRSCSNGTHFGRREFYCLALGEGVTPDEMMRRMAALYG
jgi:hypothetical protein